LGWQSHQRSLDSSGEVAAMQARDQIISGTTQETRHTGQVFFTDIGAVIRNRVIPGPLIKSSRSGHYTTYNPWNYGIEKWGRWRTKGNGYGKTWYIPDPNIWTRWENYLSGSLLSLPTWERADLYNQALDRLNDRVRGGLDLSIALAESGTTARMFRAVGKTLSHAVSWKRYVAKGFRPSNLRNWIADGSKGAANGWLQWQYGWRPLLGDVYQAADESRRFCLGATSRFRGSKRENREVSTTQFHQIWPVGANQLVPVMVTGQFTQACTINLALDDLNGFDLARWTSLNPISIAWELIPFSFVADWFFDLGSMLRATETALLYNSRFKGGYVSELYRVELDGFVDFYQPPSGDCLLNKVGSYRDDIQFQRTILSSYPLPRKPSVKVALGTERLLSAASLLRQMLK
jgi:hypothetical protein